MFLFAISSQLQALIIQHAYKL